MTRNRLSRIRIFPIHRSRLHGLGIIVSLGLIGQPMIVLPKGAEAHSRPNIESSRISYLSSLLSGESLILAGDIRTDQPPQGSQMSEPTPIEEVTSVDELFTRFRDEQPPLGTRGDVCAIAPGQLGDTGIIWSDRPFFAWRGAAQRLVVREFYSNDVIWEQDISTLAPHGVIYQVAYTGEPLPAGQLYSWQLIDGSEASDEFLFEIMTAEERERIGSGIPSGDVLAQAKYFAQAGLWSDALEVVYKQSGASTELTDATEALARYLCRDE